MAVVGCGCLSYGGRRLVVCTKIKIEEDVAVDQLDDIGWDLDDSSLFVLLLEKKNRGKGNPRSLLAAAIE